MEYIELINFILDNDSRIELKKIGGIKIIRLEQEEVE